MKKANPSQAQDDKPRYPVILSLFCEESQDKKSKILHCVQDDKFSVTLGSHLAILNPHPVILSFFCEES
jgi:hypothetical protein